jgi:hypothetical protein
LLADSFVARQFFLAGDFVARQSFWRAILSTGYFVAHRGFNQNILRRAIVGPFR